MMRNFVSSRLPSAAALALLFTSLATFVTYRYVTYNSPYTPHIAGDVQFDMSACQLELINLTDSYNKEHNLLSLADLDAGIHLVSPVRLTAARSPKPLAHYAAGAPFSAAWQRWEARPTRFHVLWEDTTGMCSCHQCMHKLGVLIRSFLATQDLERCTMTIWAAEPRELTGSAVLAPMLPWVRVQKYDPFQVARGTFLEGSPLLSTADDRVYVQGDLFRWLVLHVHGGVYVDADSILLNDFAPLLDKGDFWGRWACTDYMSPGIMSLQKGGVVTREILQRLMATDPTAGGYVWGRNTMTPWYDQKLQKLKLNGALDKDEAQLPFVAPACYFYPEWCAEQFHPYFDAPSSPAEPRPLYLHGFAYHWHGAGGARFRRSYAKNSQFDLTARYVNKLLAIKFGLKGSDERGFIDAALANADLKTDLTPHRHQGLSAWDSEHWYTTAFNPYVPGKKCVREYVRKRRQYAIIYGVLLFLVLVCCQLLITGGVRRICQLALSTVVAIFTFLHRQLRAAANRLESMLYTVVRTCLVVRSTADGNECYMPPAASYTQSTRSFRHRYFNDPHGKEAVKRVLLIVALTGAVTVALWHTRRSRGCGLGGGGEYSLGVYMGDKPLTVSEHGAYKHGVTNPVLTRLAVTDRPARSVADPFIVLPTGAVGDHSRWLMFFEVQPDGPDEDGDIALATSSDALTWTYSGVVLAEAFPLSYPYVFHHQGRWFMVLDTAQRGQVRLYESLSFPSAWVLSAVLLDAGVQWLHPSIVQHEGSWYLMVVGKPSTELRLFHSDTLFSGWCEHPASPIARGEGASLPAGRILVQEAGALGKPQLYRFAQGNAKEGGYAVEAFRVVTLTRSEYYEVREQGPFLEGSGRNASLETSPWNEDGMHHIDVQQLRNGKYIAAVDGCGKNVA